tara:strand:- start:466 stop:1713 length:1248 start_codon:yes stop_codon:yes gene_type:complete
MENNLENSIKESIKGYEAPYKAAAWTAMSAKLDVQMPTGSTGGSSFKWIAAGAAVLVVASASYFGLKEDTTVQENLVTVAENTNNVSTQDDNTSTENVTTTTQDNIQPTLDKETEETKANSEEPIIETGGDQTSGSEILKLDQLQADNSTIKTDSSNDKNQKTDNPDVTISIPSVADHCAGKFITLKNTNASEMIVEGPNYVKTIAPGTTSILNFMDAGSYRIRVGSTTNSFEVKSLPKVDFDIDTDNKFNKGLPTTQLIGVSGSNLEWSFNNSSIKGTDIDAHFFQKGYHSVKLTTTGTNGCSNSITKEHYVSEDYNLMAVNAFIPGHHDPLRNTFMPYALIERNVKFNLIVLDPKDGHTVFQTNDSSNGWDGIDKRTGMQVKKESTYIWKVTVENPEKGESNEYAGNIIPISK